MELLQCPLERVYLLLLVLNRPYEKGNEVARGEKFPNCTVVSCTITDSTRYYLLNVLSDKPILDFRICTCLFPIPAYRAQRKHLSKAIIYIG